MKRILSMVVIVILSMFLLRIEHASAQFDNGEHYVTINGVRHWYRIAGASNGGTPIVVVHGGPGGSVYTFEHSVGPALERFATVVYYDQRGSGRSDAPPEDAAYSIKQLVSDIDGLRKSLGAEKITPLGFSFGGELALEYALAHQDHVERLILQSSSNGDWVRIATYQTYGFALLAEGERRSRLFELTKSFVGDSERRFTAIWSDASRDEVHRFLFESAEAAQRNEQLWRESGHVNTGKMANALLSAPPRKPVLTDELHRIHVPVLVMVGLHDRNVGVDSNREIADSLPNAQLVIFEHSAHFPDLEEPEKYASSIRRFLRNGHVVSP